MTTDVRTNRRIVLAARPQGAADAGLLSPGRGADRRASRGRGIAAHPVAVARSLHARTHERRALLCPAGRDRRRHDGANRGARREIARIRIFASANWCWPRAAGRSSQISDGSGLVKLPPGLSPPSQALGVLGMPGFTAYVGLLDIGKPQARGNGGRRCGYRCRGLGRRTDRKTQRLPRRRDRRRRREMRLGGRATGVRCVRRSPLAAFDEIVGSRMSARHRRVLSKTSAARYFAPCCP